MAEMYQAYSPYNYTLNNPVRLIDPNGMWVEEADRYTTNDSDEIRDFISQHRGGGENEKTYDGGTLPEHTVSAPRAFSGVLGRAADSWMGKGLNRSTYGNLNVNFNHHKLDPLNLIPDYFGFYGQFSFAFHDLGYSVGAAVYEIGGQEQGGELYVSHGRTFGYTLSVEFGAHWGYSKKSSLIGNNLEHHDFEGWSSNISGGYGMVNVGRSSSPSTHGYSLGVAASLMPVRGSGGVSFIRSKSFLRW